MTAGAASKATEGVEYRNTNLGISALRMQTSLYGKRLPLLYGRARTPGNLIWCGDVVATTKTVIDGNGNRIPTTTYKAGVLIGICEGPIIAIKTVYRNKDVLQGAGAQDAVAQAGLTLFLGSYSQLPFGYLTTKHPSEALNYRGVAYVANGSHDFGYELTLQNLSFEVEGLLPYSSSIRDANPKDIIYDLLTNTSYGLSVPPSAIASLTQYNNYCVANGLFVSPNYVEPRTASGIIGDLLSLTNSEMVFSEGVIKIIPRGDVTVTGNSVTYTPNTTPIYDLTPDDYLVDGDEDPIVVTRAPQDSSYNHVQVKYADRSHQYNDAVVTAKDQTAIELYGERTMQGIEANEITDTIVARNVAQIVLQRALYLRNSYEFRLGWKYAALEPMDPVTLTEPTMGMDKVPVRVLAIEENEWGDLSITAEDFPAGVGAHAVYPAQTTAGYGVDYNVDPGNVAAPVFFEPPVELATETGLEVWVAVSGVSAIWGGAEVWYSLDGSTYQLFGTIKGGSRYGSLATAMGLGGNADVQLSGLGGQLLSGTAQDAQLFTTLCYLGGTSPEWIAYQTATLTGTNRYTLSGINAGGYGTTAAAHATGTPFVRVDQAIVKSAPLESSMIGKTLYFKFVSFNAYGGGLQDISTVTVYPYTITGAMLALPPPAVDTWDFQRLSDGTRRYAWSMNSEPADVRAGGGYRIRYASGSVSDWNAMTPLHVGVLKSSPYESNDLAAGTWTVAIKSVDALGNESTTAKFLTQTIGDPRLKNALLMRLERDLGWPGTLTGCFRFNGSLYATTSSAITGLPATISALAATIDGIGTNTSPIVYETPVMDLGVNTTFTPLVTFTGQGTATIQMRTGTTADGGATSAYGALAQCVGKRYIQIKVSIADTAPRADQLTIILDGEIAQDDFNDIATATETATWYQRIAAGHFRVGSKSGKLAAISQATITSIQNTGAAYTWELVNKTSTVNSQPAAEFKVRNATDTLQDALVDVILRGPKQ